MKEVSGKKFEEKCRDCPQLLRFEVVAEPSTEKKAGKTLSAKIDCRVEKCMKEV